VFSSALRAARIEARIVARCIGIKKSLQTEGLPYRQSRTMLYYSVIGGAVHPNNPEITMTIKLIDSREIDRDYGFAGTEAIVEQPEYGRLLIADGYGEKGLCGGMVRWEHGIAIQLQPGDDFASLDAGGWNDAMCLRQAVLAGYDDTRPVVIGISGAALARIARAAGCC
jgi:hypothetical protein